MHRPRWSSTRPSRCFLTGFLMMLVVRLLRNGPASSRHTCTLHRSQHHDAHLTTVCRIKVLSWSAAYFSKSCAAQTCFLYQTAHCGDWHQRGTVCSTSRQSRPSTSRLPSWRRHTSGSRPRRPSKLLQVPALGRLGPLRNSAQLWSTRVYPCENVLKLCDDLEQSCLCRERD